MEGDSKGGRKERGGDGAVDHATGRIPYFLYQTAFSPSLLPPPLLPPHLPQSQRTAHHHLVPPSLPVSSPPLCVCHGDTMNGGKYIHAGVA